MTDANKVSRGFDLVDAIYQTMHPRRGGHYVKGDYNTAYDIAYAHEADVLAAAGSISTYQRRRLV